MGKGGESEKITSVDNLKISEEGVDKAKIYGVSVLI